MRAHISLSVSGLALGLALAACSPSKDTDAGPVTTARLMNAASEPQNWMTHGGTYLEQRFSPLDQVTDANVGQLKLAWFHDLDTNRAQEATPLIIDGVMYTTTAWSKVVALDAASGKELWTYDPEVPGPTGFKACCDVVNRGLASYEGKLFLGTLDGRLIAIDIKTGKPVWSVVTVDQFKPYTITGAPRVVKGRVLIGNGGAEYGVRGYVTAYDAATGKQAWRFYTVPGKLGIKDGAASDDVLEAKSRGTWFGDKYPEYGGGGTVWDAIVYDPELDQLYIGVGNGSPWNRKIRSEDKGDNLFLSSVVALNPDTGKYLWHYQGTPGETWDFTQTQPIILATLPIAGKPTKVLMQAPKNGFFYVIDRTSGKLISAKGFVPQTWTTGVDMATGRPIEVAGARYPKDAFLMAPSAYGAHNWHPMSFSPKTGLVYLPAQEIPLAYLDDNGFKKKSGGWNIAIDVLLNVPPKDGAQKKAIRALLKGQLVAWDPVAQKEVWREQYDGPWNGGTLATGGNLVFQGNAKGQFQAFRADKGGKVWSFDAQTGVVAGPVSYSVAGKQYVAVMAGYGGAYPLASPYNDHPRPMPYGRVLVFALDGKAILPKAQPIPNAPANPPADKFTAAQIAAGAPLYEGTCAACHGSAAISSGVLPDLRRSGALSDKATWQGIVHDGQLESRGMIGFAKYFTPAEIENIRAYVGDAATRLTAEEAAAK